MDPWLEQEWGDVHHRLIQYGCDLIADRLPRGLFAAVEETVYITGEWSEGGRARPDVGVFGSRRDPARPGPASAGNAGAIAEPLRIRLVEQTVVEGHIVIRKLGGGQPLVTAIEVVSPTNKKDRRARRDYVSKREAYYDAGANVVEIDLLRAGEPLIDVPWGDVPSELITPYGACVRRAAVAEVELEAEYYRLPLRERLAVIGVPLRMGDEDVALDLQALIDEAYARGRYSMRVDYEKGPEPPLGVEDAGWVAERVRARRAE